MELVTDYLEGRLDPASRSAVEDHLALCVDCTSYVRQVRRMLRLTAGTLADTAEPVPPELLEALTSRYRRRR